MFESLPVIRAHLRVVSALTAHGRRRSLACTGADRTAPARRGSVWRTAAGTNGWYRVRPIRRD